MNEKILVSSQSYDIKKGVGIFLLVLAVIALVISVGIISDEFERATYIHEKYCYDFDGSLDCDCYGGSPLAKTIHYFLTFQGTIIWGIYAGCALICGLIYLWLKSYEITVTDKRVYGKVAFGKRVDLPNDSISAIATVSLFKGVAVSTSPDESASYCLKTLPKFMTC